MSEACNKITADVELDQTHALAANSILAERLTHKIVMIEKRTFISECLARSLRRYLDADVSTFPDIASWKQNWDGSTPALIIVSCAAPFSSSDGMDIIDELACRNVRAPIVLFSDALDKHHILESMRHGVQGYIPTTTSFDVAIEAIRLVLAGGQFVPAESILDDLRAFKREADQSPASAVQLTVRERMIVQALCTGSQNKQISYSLNLSESTVRVHVHNIMRKLHAKNRTEVVVKLFNRDLQS